MLNNEIKTNETLKYMLPEIKKKLTTTFTILYFALSAISGVLNQLKILIS